MSWHDSPDDPMFAGKAAATHDLLRAVLRCERRVRRPPGPKRSAKPPEKPKGAEDVLAKLAERHEVGEVLGISQVASATGCSTGAALAIRRWAESVGRWPYGLVKVKAEAGSDRRKPTRLELEFEAVLAAVAKRYPPGSRVGAAEIIDAAGCTNIVALEVRRLARDQGRWPYELAASFRGGRPKGGVS
jgi:hypothetical protein